MRRILFLVIIGMGGAGILLGLGIWQVQRLNWKQDILAQIEARISQAPVAIPADPDPVTDKYLAIEAEGYILPESLRVLVSKKDIGAGYRIISPFLLNDRVVLLDRGFIPAAQTLPKADLRMQVQHRVTGNLHWPVETDSYTPAPDLENNIWFSRDVAQMARALNADPILIVAREMSPLDGPVTPWPVDSARLPNDHLQYAITWFSLAAIWLMMSLYFSRPAKRPTQSRDKT